MIANETATECGVVVLLLTTAESAPVQMHVPTVLVLRMVKQCWITVTPVTTTQTTIVSPTVLVYGEVPASMIRVAFAVAIHQAVQTVLKSRTVAIQQTSAESAMMTQRTIAQLTAPVCGVEQVSSMRVVYVAVTDQHV